MNDFVNARRVASQAGFRAVDVKGVTVLLNQTVRADVRLEPGALDQRVSVTAEAPLVQSETSSISSIACTATTRMRAF